MTCSVYIIDNLPEGQGINSIEKSKSNSSIELPAYWLAASSLGKIASSRKVYSTFLEFLLAEKSVCTADYIMFASTSQKISKEDLRDIFAIAAANKTSANFFPTISTEELLSEKDAAEIYGCSILLLDCNAQTEARIPFQGLVLSRAFFAEVAAEACKLKTREKSLGSWRETSRSLDGIVSKVACRLGQKVRVHKRPSLAHVRSQGIYDIVSLRESFTANILELSKAAHKPKRLKVHIQKYWECLKNLDYLECLIKLLFMLQHNIRRIKSNHFNNWTNSLRRSNRNPDYLKKYSSLGRGSARSMLKMFCSADFCRVEVLRLDLELPTNTDE